jgi:3',5'-cyclic AMP phosphodiesterase CpdA
MATRLFHISDVHFGVEDRAALDRFAQAVEEEQPDAVVCSGDITQRAKRSEYAAAQSWLGALGVPLVLQPGNHDMPYYNPWERFSDPFRRFRRLNEAIGSSLELEDVALVPLLTTVAAQRRFPWSDGVVRSSALAETLERLESLRSDPRHKLVVAHHPLLGPDDGRRNPTIGGDEAFERIAEAGADAILSGHVHVPFDQVRERGGKTMRTIGAGTLSIRLREGAPASYRVITCERGGPIESELRLMSA